MTSTTQNAFKDALRSLRRQSSKEPVSYAFDLFPVGWSYAPDTQPGPSEPVVGKVEKAAGEVQSATVERSASVTEKTRVLDSLHEFAQEQLEGAKKDSISFPGGEVRKKSPAGSVFQDAQSLDLAGLRDLSGRFGIDFTKLKYSTQPKAPIKALFVAAESSDSANLANAEIALEAFFEAPAAQLFDKMLKAMKFSEGECFVSSLKVLSGGESHVFEGELASEIYNLKPQIVVPLGGVATAAFLGSSLSLQSSHGQFYEKEVFGPEGSFAFEVMPLFSPAFLVEAPNTKRIAWEDMQKAMKKLGH